MINQYMDNTYSKSIEKPQNVLNNWQSICRFSREIEPGPGSIEPSRPAAGSGHNWRSRNSWSSRTSWRIINWCRDILKITYKDCEPRDPWRAHSICRKPESAEKTWSWKMMIISRIFLIKQVVTTCCRCPGSPVWRSSCCQWSPGTRTGRSVHWNILIYSSGRDTQCSTSERSSRRFSEIVFCKL